MSRYPLASMTFGAVDPVPTPGPVLQRRCACGGRPGPGGECEECRKKRLELQRKPLGRDRPAAPRQVESVLRSAGAPLPSSLRADMERGFGHDFGGVRIHTDRLAAESARDVHAEAYTVGRHIAFASGAYAPETDRGRGLLAHELTHVIQQRHGPGGQAGGGVTVGPADSAAERQARSMEATASKAAQGGPLRSPVTAPAMVMRNGDGEGESGPRTHPGCTTDEQNADIEAARRSAAIRSQTALLRVGGVVPAGPPSRGDASEDARREARRLARQIFGEDLNMDQVERIISRMVTRLTNPDLAIECAAPGDSECGSRAGYVRGLRPPVYLCPSFFEPRNAEQQARTMVHEAAHLAGLGEEGGETYCAFFDCETSCGGFHSADSWAHYIHCLSGQTPDDPEAVEGEAGE